MSEQGGDFGRSLFLGWGQQLPAVSGGCLATTLRQEIVRQITPVQQRLILNERIGKLFLSCLHIQHKGFK